MDTDATDDQAALLAVSERFMEETCPLTVVRQSQVKSTPGGRTGFSNRISIDGPQSGDRQQPTQNLGLIGQRHVPFSGDKDHRASGNNLQVQLRVLVDGLHDQLESTVIRAVDQHDTHFSEFVALRDQGRLHKAKNQRQRVVTETRIDAAAADRDAVHPCRCIQPVGKIRIA